MKLQLNLAAGQKLALPSLDFSNLKHVKESDYYAQCKKLEEVIIGLRKKVQTLEAKLEESIIRNYDLIAKLKEQKVQTPRNKELEDKSSTIKKLNPLS